jgi:hypothetical protein
MSEYTRDDFIRDRGWQYKSEDTLNAAYARQVKCRNNDLLTREEYLAERCAETDYDVIVQTEIYDALVTLVANGKLRPAAVYEYARYRWLTDAASLACYKTDQGWEVNNCGTEVSEAAAIIAVNSEWGFEASRIKVIGTPYYDATDYQFIRFDCAHMTWLWKNGNIFQVYE